MTMPDPPPFFGQAILPAQCIYRAIPDRPGFYRCAACAKETLSPLSSAPKGNCQKAPGQLRYPLGLRSEAEVAQLIETHCEDCDHFPIWEVCDYVAKCAKRVPPEVWRARLRDKRLFCPENHWGKRPVSRRPGPGPVTVLFCTPSLHSAGAERWVASLVSCLDPTVIRVVAVVLTGKQSAAHDSGLVELVRRTCPILPPAEAGEAARGADVAIVWGGHRLSGAVEHFGGRVVWVNHSATENGRRMAARAATEVDHLVAVSDAAAEFLPPEWPHTVLRNGVDLSRCSSVRPALSTRAGWGLAPQSIAVAYIGRQHADKHPEKIAEACELLGVPYTPVYIGEANGPDRLTLLGACRRSLFAGHVSHIGDALSAVDVVALISDHEAMSLTLCEAWAAGVPVVATPVGAVPELEQSHGPMVCRTPVGAGAAEVADAVCRALDEDNESVVRRARAVTHSHYSLEAMGRRWTSFLLAVARGREWTPAPQQTGKTDEALTTQDHGTG